MAFAMTKHDDMDFIRHLRETPVGRQVTAKIADARTASRTAAIDRLAIVRAEATAERGKFEQAFAAAQGTVREAEHGLKTALDAARSVLAKHDADRFAADAEIQSLETELLQSAPPAVADFIRWASEEHHLTLQMPLTQEVVQSDQINPTTGRKITLLKTNARAISDRATSLLNAKAAAAQLALSIAALDEIAARIAELRNGVPIC